MDMDKELQKSSLSIEEVGVTEEYIPPETRSDDEEEVKQDSHYLVLFADTKKLQKPLQEYRLYLINANNEKEFAKVLHKIIQLEKKNYDGTQVHFLSDCADLYRIKIKCENCAHWSFKIPEDKESFCCKLDSSTKEFLSLEELLALQCKHCGSSTSLDMRLGYQESFKSCFEFQLACNNKALRTPSKAKICVTAFDTNGQIIWKDEMSFAVCFNNMDGTSTDYNQKTDYQVLKKKHQTILSKMTHEKEVIQFLIKQKVLREDFEIDKWFNKKDLIGYMLRHLSACISAGSSSVLTEFINALRATKMRQNLELADILCDGK